MFHINEQQALRVSDKIIEFARRHFRDKRNWKIEDGAERVYSYATPTIGEFFFERDYKLFEDVSEPAFLFVLRQMKKCGSVSLGFTNESGRPVYANPVYVAPHYLNAFEIMGVSSTTDAEGRAHFRFAGNPHTNEVFSSRGAL
jgi:hypothetical protein